MLDQIRRFLTAVPFRPFQVHASSGVIFNIDHPENAAVVKHKVIIALPDPEDAVAVISALHVASVIGVETSLV